MHDRRPAGSSDAIVSGAPEPRFELGSKVAGQPPRRDSDAPEILLTSLPSSIPGYAIERELGRGGAAIVYLARELKHRRLVAIKVLRPELAASLHADRFLREIEISAGLAHPNILPLLDSGTHDGRLYLVTPYEPGGSVRLLLDRNGPLAIHEAVRIAREVADALHYAHRQGVVHRDIKPDNVLLSDGHALVADFGISLAMDAADHHRLTATGLTLGTSSYMSPEQCTGEGVVDGRSDIYSLGCVLYELIAGEPPFRGVTSLQLAAQHLTARVSPLRAVRPVSRSLERVVMTALAKSPADRFATAAEFSRALLDAPTTDESWLEETRALMPWWRARRLAAIALVAVLAGGIIFTTVRAASDWRSRATESGRNAPPTLPDTSRFVVLPFTGRVGSDAEFDVWLRLHDAFARWSGISVVDPSQVTDAVARGHRGEPAVESTRRIATELGAGRYVSGELSTTGSDFRLHAALHDTRTGALLETGVIRIGTDLANADSAVAALAERLLFRGDAPIGRTAAVVETRSAPARQAENRARAALAEWDLVLADSMLVLATQHDPDFAQAYLKLAQIRSWLREPPLRWRFAAERAAAGRESLAPEDRQLSDALLALARGDVVGACGLFAQITERSPQDFEAWYGLGTCLRNDKAVLPDPSSPTGWRFRTSYNATLDAYGRAFQLLPSIHRSFRGGSFQDVRLLLMTSTDALRGGEALPPDTTQFLAHPTWQGDSLAFVPQPAFQFAASTTTLSDAANAATLHQRQRFHEIATMFRAAYPRSVDAVEAVAIALDLLGNPSAFDTLRLARRLATAPDDRRRIAAAEVWLRVKYAIPADLTSLRAARELADSILDEPATGDREEARMLAGLAALTGRAARAASFARLAEGRVTPPAIAHSAPALLAFAAIGGPTDSIRRLERDVDRALRTGMTGSRRDIARAEWLVRAAFLAIPDVRFTTESGNAGGSSLSGRIIAAWRASDTSRAIEILTELRDARRRGAVRAAEITLDMLHAEAAVLASLGQERAALAWLAPTLDSLSFSTPETLSDVARAGGLIRAMALRADLADRLGDRVTARLWAAPVATLWDVPDDFFLPMTQRMRALAR